MQNSITGRAIDQAIKNLQVISEHAGQAPEPHNIRIEMRRLANSIATPLVRAVLEARMACKRLKEQLTAAQKEVYAKNTEICGLTNQLSVMRNNARGNVVLLRRDGFSKPMDIAPTFSPFGPGYTLPHIVKMHDMPEPNFSETKADFSKVSYRTWTFAQTTRKDGFGRTIFEQV